MSEEFFFQLLYGLFMAGAVYGGIRSDIKSAKDKADAAKESADKAHARLDGFLTIRKG